MKFLQCGMTSNQIRNTLRDLTRAASAQERSGLGAGVTTVVGPLGQRLQILEGDTTADSTGDDGLDEAGFTLFCATRSTDGYGNTVVTDVKIRKKWGRLFYCEPVDECCLPAWWCISNSWVETAAMCCTESPGVSITRIVKVVFTSVSGATLKELGLPVTAYFVNESGSLVWSGASSSGILWDLGLNQVTGGIEWFCDGGTLKAQVTLSNFTDGTPATSSCTLTDVAVDLGNHTVTRTVTKICPVSGAMYTEEVTGVVGVTVASYIDGSGDPITGVVNYGEFLLPPWDANGPWKTEEEGLRCCNKLVEYTIATCSSDYKYFAWESIYIRIKNATGIFINAESRIPLVNGWYSQSASGVPNSFPTTHGFTYSTVFGGTNCITVPTKIYLADGFLTTPASPNIVSELDYLAPGFTWFGSGGYFGSPMPGSSTTYEIPPFFPVPTPTLVSLSPFHWMTFRVKDASTLALLGTAEVWIEPF